MWRAHHSSRGILPSVMCLGMIVNPRHWWDPGPVGVVAPLKRLMIWLCRPKHVIKYWITKILNCDGRSQYYFEPVIGFTLNIVLVSKRLSESRWFKCCNTRKLSNFVSRRSWLCSLVLQINAWPWFCVLPLYIHIIKIQLPDCNLK
jgi:hypothetical protein